VKVQALTYDAQVGRTGGGVFNTLLRSGSNALHGSIFGETRQTAWLANDFFANRSGTPRPDSPYYNWGASLGGPIFIPNVYDGRNKTFFWIGSEGYIQTSPYTQTFTVPTDLQRSGDFSQTFNADGSQHIIYNPFDTYTDAIGVHRRPFPRNRISNLNTVGKNIASYFPSPTPGTSTFIGTDNVRDHAQEVTVKLDQQIRPWWNVSGSYIFYEALQPLGNPLHTLPGSYSYTYHRQVDAIQVNSTWILNPTTVITARYGTNRFSNLIAEVSQGFDPANLGFPTSLTSQLQAKFFPTIFFANHDQLGQNTSQLDNWKSQIVNGTLAKTAGRHNLTFGAEYRRIRMNYQDFGNAPGTYTFSGAFTQADPSSSNGGSGSDIADLLLGLPISGQIDITTQLNTYLDYNAVFVQDDWRLSSKLTLNLGLRWESETGLKENNNQLAVGFDRTAKAQLSNGTQVTDGILFAGVNGNQRDTGDLSRAKFAPRLGASYQFTPKTVMRGGYAILYAPTRYDPVAALAPGYTQTNSYVASNDNGFTPANSLSNPFPGGLAKPAGNSAGLLTGVGNSVTTYDQNFHAPRVQQFSVDIERELPGHIALDAAYIGTRAINLSPSPSNSTAVNINQLNPSNFSLGSSLNDQRARRRTMRPAQPSVASGLRDSTCSVTTSPGLTFFSASRNAARVRVGTPFTAMMMSGPPGSSLDCSRWNAGPSGETSVTTRPPPRSSTDRSRTSRASSWVSGSTEMPSVSSLLDASLLDLDDAAATALSASLGARASRTVTVFFSPPWRRTVTSTVSPGFLKATRCCSCGVLSTGWPSTATITSPGWIPAFLAGESSLV